MSEPRITAERVRELLHYDPETGVFTRLLAAGGELPGSVAGNVDPAHGYIRIRVDGILHKAHRLAWLYVTGDWPKSEIDHQNTNRRDNRWDNLREATTQQNNQNTLQARSDSRSGQRGVSWLSTHGKWRATITVDGKQRHLGYFNDADAAASAYREAKGRFHPFAHGLSAS